MAENQTVTSFDALDAAQKRLHELYAERDKLNAKIDKQYREYDRLFRQTHCKAVEGCKRDVNHPGIHHV